MDNQNCSIRVLGEVPLPDRWVQLLEDRAGGVYLREVSADRETILSNASIFSDPSALAEARELFPDLLPLGGMPVDAA
ncbi:MAG: hypothetical protein HY892_21310 [Deltaproteobacteria bacterium]|nr:hypothetical protein [Deltaproteobacteria bacterium]